MVVSAQNAIGIPWIIRYSKEAYRAGTQDRSGRMYVANDEGLLTIDGYFWKLHPLPNETNIRLIAIADDGRILQEAREHSIFSYTTQAENFRTNRLFHFCLQGTEFRCYMGFRSFGVFVIFRV